MLLHRLHWGHLYRCFCAAELPDVSRLSDVATSVFCCEVGRHIAAPRNLLVAGVEDGQDMREGGRIHYGRDAHQ